MARPNASDQPKNVVRRTLHAYLAQSQIHGYKIIVSPQRPLLERVCWTALSLAGIVFTTWLVVWAYLTLLGTPTVTTQRPGRVSVLGLPFPAVAFCSENRISREALEELASVVLNATADAPVQIGRNVSEVAESLLVLGKMYDLRTDSEDFYLFDRVHAALTHVYDGVYPIQQILANLAPKCEHIVRRCKWLGRITDCSALFTLRRTYLGNCCAFNYNRPIGSELRRQAAINRTVTLAESRYVRKHGAGFGLAVLLDQRLDDYAFAMHSNRGVRILIFDPVNFPDATSAAVKEKFIGRNEEMFLTVAPQPNHGSEEMRKYDRALRSCVFADEIALLYDKFYTLSECLLVCRLAHLRRECGCLLPQYSTAYERGGAASAQQRCLLDDMPCLGRWNQKWYNADALVSATNRTTRPDSLVLYEQHCPACLPLCNMIKYYVESSTSNFVGASFDGRVLDEEFTRGLSAANHSIVYVNFAAHKVAQFDQNNFSTWYEQLATFGGLASLTFGASLISVLEIVYFVTGKFGALHFRRTDNESGRPSTGGRGLLLVNTTAPQTKARCIKCFHPHRRLRIQIL